MAQPSVACFFNSRKRAAIDDTKINQARKVLVLDSSEIKTTIKDRSEIDKGIIYTQVPQDSLGSRDECPSEKLKKLQEEEKISANKIVALRSANSKTANKKGIKATRVKKMKTVANNNDIQDLFNKMSKPQTTVQPDDEIKKEVTEIDKDSLLESESHRTPPRTPTKKINAMDKVKHDGPSLKEIKNKMTRSSRLSDLKASIARFQEGAKKLSEVEKKTSQIASSPKLKGFKTIELEVQTSPQKSFSPDKAYLSPRKDGSGVRKNLLNLLSPTKNAVPIPIKSPSKEILSEATKPALTLPFKYRFLAEMCRAVDTVTQILHNRKETITFRKLKPAVEEMLKRNLLEKHLGQIKTVFPESYNFTQEKLKIFGSGMRAEQWELVIDPNIPDNASMTSEILLQRRRKLFKILLDKVKDYHQEFLMTLDTPINISKDKVTRWHPEFDIEKVPDITMTHIPQPPAEDKLTTGKDVLERARVLFNCNTRMEDALQRLKDAKQTQTPLPSKEAQTAEMPQSVLKGIPKALLEKVRQKQAAKALVSMTRSANKEKEVQLYSRLPELARLTRNLFVSEKKGVLPLDLVVDKLGNCYRGNLTKAEMEEHLKVLANELPNWLVFHHIRNCVYLKLNKSADLSLVLNKLEALCKQKNYT